jgi:hypothetical protein
MITEDNVAAKSEGPMTDRFPRLANLRLSEADLVALRTQGFLSTERLPSGTRCHKPRFRRNDGKQQVRYIGIDEKAKAEVKEELKTLQANHRLDRELRRLTKRGRRLLREVKQRLTPELAAAGIRFRGHEPRWARGASSETTRRGRIVSGAVEAHEPLNKEDVNDEYGRSTESGGLLAERGGSDRSQDAENPGVPGTIALECRPLRANLGGEAGNLMRMGLRLEQAIDKSLARSTDVLQQAKGISAAMEIYLKITRQWDRLLQLDNRIADGERRGRCR